MPRYRRCQHDLIAPHCGRSVLEVGAGLGEFAPDPRLVAVYDRVVVPVTRAIERVVRVRFGQSVLGVARIPG